METKGIALLDKMHSFWRRRPSTANMRDKQFLPVPVVRTQSCVDICFASVIKNEADYLPEWIAFHALLGVSHFYLYDNGSTDDLNAAIEASGFANCVTVLPWGTLHDRTQFVAHNHAIATFGKDFRWMGFFDVDEFVFPVDANINLVAALSQFKDQPVVGLPWHMFGTSGFQTRPDGLVIENFVQKAAGEANHLNWKLFVDPTQIAMMRGHDAYLRNHKTMSPVLVNEQGEYVFCRERRSMEKFSSQVLQLNHYYTRSAEEYENKLSKGRLSKQGATVPRERIDKVVNQIESKTVIDKSAARYAPAIRSAMNNSLKLTG